MKEMNHENINPFCGVVMSPGEAIIVMGFCAKGRLQVKHLFLVTLGSSR